MKGKWNIKILISISLLIAINLLFINKYLSRVSGLAGIATLFMLIVYTGFWLVRDKIRLSDKRCTLVKTAAILVISVSSVIIFRTITSESLNVDRWSVISSFWEASFNHQYPYSAVSHLGNHPGPMPVYFLLALPFYLAGEIGYMSLFALFFFVFLTGKLKVSPSLKLWSTLFLIGSAYFLWEIACRSTIFFNSVILLGCLIWFNSINKQENARSLYFWAAVIGLSLSTRSVFAIPVIISSLAALRRNEIDFKKMVIAGLIAFSIFFMTFLPFLIFFPEDFERENPFIIQSSFLMPFYLSAIFMIFAIVASLFSRSADDDYFYSGLLLFLTIAGYFMYHIFKNGFNQAYYNSIADISYFILCTPFLLYYIIKSADKRHV
jgi:hypothetical protein